MRVPRERPGDSQMLDFRNLTLPVFEVRHQKLGEELQQWCEANFNEPEANGSLEEYRLMVRKLGQRGWFRALLTDEHQTKSIDARSVCLTREILSQYSGLADFVLAHQMHAINIIYSFGGDELQDLWLPRILSGELIATTAMAEAGWEGDASRIRAHAIREGAHWLVNGEKTWVALGEVADVLVVFARDEANAQGALSAFVVSSDTSGVDTVGRLATIDEHPVTRLRLEKVCVPQRGLIDASGRGAAIMAASQYVHSLSASAASIGFIRSILREKSSCETAITLENEMVLETMALLAYCSAWRKDQNDTSSTEHEVPHFILGQIYKTLGQLIGRDSSGASRFVDQRIYYLRGLRYLEKATSLNLKTSLTAKTT